MTQTSVGTLHHVRELDAQWNNADRLRALQSRTWAAATASSSPAYGKTVPT
ncbi:hypothetical protein ACWEPM_11510 [Streptomyces sp. NPDC004244]